MQQPNTPIKSFIHNYLSSGSYLSVNKTLMKFLGINAAIILADLISKADYFERNNMLIDGEWFFNTFENRFEDTCIGRKEQDAAIRTLENKGFIQTKLKGVPAKKHFKISHLEILQFVLEGQTGLSSGDKLLIRTNIISISKDIQKDSENHAVQSDPVLDFWNSLPNVQHHRNPDKKVYSKSIQYINLLRRGTLLSAARPFDQEWIKQVGLTDRRLTTKYTDANIRLMMKQYSNMIDPRFEPRGNKAWMKKPLFACIYDGESGGKSLLLEAYMKEPRLIKEARTDAIVAKAKNDPQAYNMEQIARAFNYARSSSTRDIKGIDGLAADEFKALRCVVEELDRIDMDVYSFPSDPLTSLCDFIRKYYEPVKDKSKLHTNYLKPGFKFWSSFLKQHATQ